MRVRTFFPVTLLPAFAVLPCAWAQPENVAREEAAPFFRTEPVVRSVKAVDYQSLGGSAQIAFRGTAEAPEAAGTASVRVDGGGAEIEASFEGLPDPQSFGREYLTLVAWAISPEGEAVNLGEIQRDKRSRAKISLATDLGVFGMVVTAEPYFAVGVPSDVIVLENAETKKTKAHIFSKEAEFELLQRGVYAPFADPYALSLDLKRTPLVVYEARNAFTIAARVGAETYAEESLRRAEGILELANSTELPTKQVIPLARQATQFAEEARALSIERQKAVRP